MISLIGHLHVIRRCYRANDRYDGPNREEFLMALRQFWRGCSNRGRAGVRASPALAVTEIQWWHAMTGGNNDVVNKLAEDFNASAVRLQGRPDLQGRLCRHA